MNKTSEELDKILKVMNKILNVVNVTLNVGSQQSLYEQKDKIQHSLTCRYWSIRVWPPD